MVAATVESKIMKVLKNSGQIISETVINKHNKK